MEEHNRVSVCCDAPIELDGKIYDCTKCEMPCDSYLKDIEDGEDII